MSCEERVVRGFSCARQGHPSIREGVGGGEGCSWHLCGSCAGCFVSQLWLSTVKLGGQKLTLQNSYEN